VDWQNCIENKKNTEDFTHEIIETVFSMGDRNEHRILRNRYKVRKVWAEDNNNTFDLGTSPLSLEAPALIEICTIPMALDVQRTINTTPSYNAAAEPNNVDDARGLL